MPKITRVDMLDGKTLDIELDNGNLILFNVSPLIETDKGFSALRGDDKSLPKPKTDGDNVYWEGCPKLTLSRIIELVAAN